jgi:hypothetical protein
MDNNLADMRKMELKLLIIEYNKASQLDRSFFRTGLSKDKKTEFRKKLLESCMYLMNKADDGTLKNEDIREKIREVKDIDSNISFGQAQKVINVSLKQYCFILNRENLLKELDCPLDTTTMKGYGIEHKRMIDVNETEYLEYQEKYNKEFGGIRVLKDYIYDEMRIRNFF